MADVKFGLQHMGNETPAILKKIYRILMGVIAIWGLIAPQFPEIPTHLVDVVNRICVVGLPIFYTICNMFGYDKPSN